MERKYFENIKQVLSALVDGEKIANKFNKKFTYLYLNDEGLFVDNNVHIFSETYIIGDPSNWYIYEPPVDKDKYLWVLKYSDGYQTIGTEFLSKEIVKNDFRYLYPVARLNEQTKKVEWL